MINQGQLLLTIAAALISAPTMAFLSSSADAYGDVISNVVSVVDPVTGDEVFVEPNLTYAGMDSVSLHASVDGFNDVDSTEVDQSFTITNESPYIVSLSGAVGVVVDASTEIFNFEFSEDTFYDSNAFVQISGAAFASGFASTNGTYSCLKTDKFCNEVFDDFGQSNSNPFELSLNPGDSVTFNITATVFAIFETPSLVNADSDNDTIADTSDNCLVESNSDQLDTDGDGYGNVCDPDFNNDCVVNFLDISAFSEGFLGTNPLFDLNGDGAVNFLDFAIVSTTFLQTPGPSGVTDTCD